jgi:hypothetical protein
MAVKQPIRIAIAALVFSLAVSGVGAGKILYEELVTVILDDGTQVVLLMDDYGVKRPKTSAVKETTFDYLEGVRAAGGQPPAPPVTVVHAPGQSQAQNKRFEQLSGMQGIGPQLARLRNHSKGILLWGGTPGPEKRYYYLPPPPRVATDADGKPQFLFMKFTSDRTAEAGGVTGGILHFLCEYGLTQEQEKELKKKLADMVPGAKVMGPVRMESGGDESTFRVISATMSEGGFTEKLVASGKAPLLPGQKVAAAARLDRVGAVLIEESLKRPTSDISVEFDLAYTAFLPAFEGKIIFDWKMFKENIDQWEVDFSSEKVKVPFYRSHTMTTEEVRNLYEFMCAHEVIKIEWTESIVDERLEAIRQSFFRMFETEFFEKQPMEMPEDEEDETMTSPDTGAVDTSYRRHNASYEYARFKARSESEFVYKEREMTVNLPVKVSYVTVGNISGNWYRQASQGHPELFAEVNVDDPFFEQRKVAFRLDIDAVDIFDEVINFVTVEVRKQRPSNRDFHTSFTLTKEVVASEGPTHMVTYAKMRDDDPRVFEYLTRWSLRGGVEWPANPRWTRGSYEGITLVPPVIPLTVEAEADLAELEELGFTRATVEIRYNQFGKEVTHNPSLVLSPARGEPLASTNIFRDRDDTDWQYRTNLYHSVLGPIRGRWRPGGADGYIYCTIPRDLRDEAREALIDAES